MLGPAKEFWLNVTNSVLGSAILIFLVLVAIGLILDVIRRFRKSSNNNHGAPLETTEVRPTLPDGGEKFDKNSS
jgi:hypothetical protein